MLSPSTQPEIASRADECRRFAGEGLELWSSKQMDLLWLPRCDNWSNPSLHPVMTGSAERKRTAPRDDAHRKCEVLRWFWRVDVTFGAWVLRAIHRAGQAGADIPGVYEARDFMMEYLGQDRRSQAESMASAGPILVPCSELVSTAAQLAKFNIGPRWDGWEKHL